MINITKVKQLGREGDDSKLSKTFVFEGFVGAIAFVNKVGGVAELLQHHPDIDIRRNKVSLSTTTHDEGDTITNKDIDLIEKVESI